MKTYIGDRNEVIVGRANGIAPDGSAVMVIARTSTTYGNGVLVMRAEDGLNWTSEFLPTTAQLAGCAYDAANNTIYVIDGTSVSNNITIRESTDFGVTWTTNTRSIGASGGSGWPAFSAVWFDAARSRLILSSGSRTGLTEGTITVLQSKDGGVTWTALHTSNGASGVFNGVSYAPNAPYPLFLRATSSTGTGVSIYKSNLVDDTLEEMADVIGTILPVSAGYTIAYSPLSKTYVAPNALLSGGSATSISFSLEPDGAPRQATVLSGNLNSRIAYIVWSDEDQQFFGSCQADTTTSTDPTLYRTFKSVYGNGGWIYDPAPIYNTQNRFGVSMFYDSLRKLVQIYSHGYTAAGRIQLGYLGKAGSLPTPTPSPTSSLTPSVSLSMTPTPSSSMAASTFDWIPITALPQEQWGTVTFDNFTYMALGGGTNSTVGMRSGDGINWTQFTKLAHSTTGTAYNGSGTYVATAVNGSQEQRLMYSADNGETWAYATNPINSGYYDAIYVNGRFLTIPSNVATVLTSVDGSAWTVSGTCVSTGARSFAANADTLVSVTSAGTTARIQYSKDFGTTWTGVEGTTADALIGVSYGNGRFVAVTNAGGSMWSTDGVTWERSTVAASYVARAITYGDGLFVVVGSSNIAYESADGISWKPSTAIGNQAWVAITYGSGKFVAVSSTGTASHSMYTLYGAQPSPTPTPTSSLTPTPTPSSSLPASTFNWIAGNPSEVATWRKTAFGNSTFVALNQNTVGMTSTDGINWTSFTRPTLDTRSLIFSGGKFVTVGSNGTADVRVASSTDGINWTYGNTLPINLALIGVTYGFSKYYAFAASGATYFTSPDAITWTAASNAVSSGAVAGAFGGNVLVTVSNFGSSRVQYSTDGVAWAATNAPDNNYTDIAYGNGRFVAVANNIVSMSTDGINWTTHTMHPTAATVTNGITFGDGLFVAVTNSNMAYESADGIAWKPSTAIANQTWVSVAYGIGKFVAVASTGTASRAMYTLYGNQPTPTPTPTPTQTPSNTPAASPVYEALSFNQFPVNGETI